MSRLVPPHGGKGLVECLLKGAELQAALKKAEGLKKVVISDRVKGDCIMLGIGGFSPLNGFMGKADWVQHRRSGAGPLRGRLPQDFPGVYKTPAEIRAEMDAKGWAKVAALQLRNPMHRSHEYLAKIAVEVCDGVVIHSLIGNLKPGDIPADVRVKCIQKLIDLYFVPANVINAGYPLDMRYAGPREALLHATFRQNYGINNLLVGRDHAGVGDFYTLFEAQEIFDKIPVSADPAKNLLCQPMKIDWTFYCYKCDGMASMRTCPHTKEDRVILSGTKLRKALSEGEPVADHFGRDEVLDILREYYAGLTEKVEVKMQKAAAGTAMK